MTTATNQAGPTSVGSNRKLRLLLVVIATAALFVTSCASTDSDSSTDANADDASTNDASTDDADGSDAASGEDDQAGAGDAEGDDQTTGDDETDDATTTTAIDDTDLAEGAEVTVLDQGAEPRVELRLQIDPGQSEVMIIDQVQELSQTIGGQAAPDVGPIGMIIEQQLTSADAGGDLLTFTSLVTSATVTEDVNPLVATELQTALDGMVGVTTRSVVDTRGRVLKAELDGLQSIDPTVASTMEQLTTSSQFSHPLPEEPVGVGAKWQVSQMLPLNGLEVEQVTSYEVLSIDGSVVELALASEQLVDVGDELVAEGASATVLLWEGVSSASITYDLTSMVPSSTTQLFANQELEFGPGAEKTVLEQSIQTTLIVSQG